MRDYGKVFSRIWESADFRALTEDGRALVMYLLTCQHGTIAGVFRVPDGYACEDLQWTVERVAKAFDDVLRKGFANRCGTSKWVWVIKFLEWNPPENPNQRKAAAKVANSVPADCCWKLDFMRVSGPLIGINPPAPSNPSGTLGEGLPNQYQEQKQYQEQEQKQEHAGANAPGSLRPPGVREIADLRDQVFATGVVLLTTADVEDKHARSFLAAQCKAHGEARVLEALQLCAQERPGQPVSWLVQVLKDDAAKGKGKPNAQEALEASNRAVADRFLAKRSATNATQ